MKHPQWITLQMVILASNRALNINVSHRSQQYTDNREEVRLPGALGIEWLVAPPRFSCMLPGLRPEPENIGFKLCNGVKILMCNEEFTE